MSGDAVGTASGGLMARGRWAGMGQGHSAGGIREANCSVLAAGHHQVFGSHAVGWGSSHGTMRHIPAGTGQQQCKGGGLSDRQSGAAVLLSSSF